MLDAALKAQFLQDIIMLSIAWTQDVSSASRNLFFEKWEAVDDAVTKQVVAQFKATWTNNALSNWSRCDLPNCVVNNNGLESTNRVLKDDVTGRKLIPILNF